LKRRKGSQKKKTQTCGLKKEQRQGHGGEIRGEEKKGGVKQGTHRSRRIKHQRGTKNIKKRGTILGWRKKRGGGFLGRKATTLTKKERA